MAKDISSLLKKSIINSEFQTKDIPNIDLYMDQVISFINREFAPSGEEKEKFLTKTMIHNYSKEGLIKPVKGKKYTKEHIIQMIIIYQLKNTLKISDIKDILTAVYQWDEYNDESLAACYDKHMSFRENTYQLIEEFTEKVLSQDNLNIDDREDSLVLLLNLAFVSYSFKALAENLISHIKAE